MGVILKMRLPCVNLKYVTCKMTDSVSQMYTKPTRMSTSGISNANASPQTAAPRKSEPVSPMKTLAG